MTERPILFGGVLMDNPYIDPPTIPAGQTIAAYQLAHPRKRTRAQRLWRRLYGHG